MSAILTENEYPSYYAGAYLNDDKELVVVLTEETNDVVDTIQQATQNNKVIVEYAEYSLNYLKALKCKLVDTYQQLTEIRKNDESFPANEANLLEDISGFYIDEVANAVAVEIKNISDEKIIIFKSLFGEDSGVRFEEGVDIEFTAAEWRPGNAVYGSTSARSSTGYRCYYIDENGVRYNGFASAGHGFSVGEAVYRMRNNGYQIGVCKASQFGGNSDVSFIAITDSSYEGSNIMMYSDGNGSEDGVTISATGYVGTVATNTTIYKVGSSTFLTQGYIISTDHMSAYDDGSSVNNLYKTTTYVEGGDSGGCAYIYSNGEYVAAGTISSRASIIESGEFAYSTISPISNARTDLGLRKY